MTKALGKQPGEQDGWEKSWKAVVFKVLVNTTTQLQQIWFPTHPLQHTNPRPSASGDVKCPFTKSS